MKLAIIALSIATLPALGQQTSQRTASAPATATSSQTTPALPDFTQLVKEYGDAVVNVNVVAQRDVSGNPQMSPEDPLYEFFRRFGIPGVPGGGGNLPPARGQGSGCIISEDGYVLTNAHVVAQASDVTVKLTDRREFPAKVIGVDPRTDVAVLKINAKNLPTVKFGDPSKLQPGEWVVAIGSPFGFENSVTAGVVSATSRALGAENSIVPFIQTDVAVNPGNSGGPLFNLRGEVVGINSQIYSATGGYQGVSFAIPIDVALNVQRQLVATGRVTRGRIGVSIQDVTAQLAESFGLDRPRGALVSSVEEGGPADKAGLKPGDVILGVNGEEIDQSGLLPSVVANLKPGTQAQLQIWRDGKQINVTVPIAQLDEPDVQRLAGRTPDGTSETPRLGLSVRPLTPQEKQQVETTGSLIVEQVSGPAAVAGVLPGDIVLAVGNQKVDSVQQLQEITKKAGDTIALLIQRQDAQIFVPVQLG